MSVFKKILIANRGEIAVRVIRACRDMGITSVAVYSAADRSALHVVMADEARLIGPPSAAESYLRVDRVLDAAKDSGAEAIHPGYGFLAENPALPRACEDAGIVFIGPRSDTISLMGEKTAARRAALDAGLPVVPGTLAPAADLDAVRSEGDRLGFPLMLKAAGGGGGKGLRLVRSDAELAGAWAAARGEALGAFGDDRVYLEKAIVKPRHIEIQVLADHHGHAVHLFERECSVQRRHQKVIEESPSPFLSSTLRAEMGALAVALVERVGYRNAGTIEFILDQQGNPYFLEMNTRLQVEHPVTEMVTGLDLVRLQVEIAAGARLPFRQEDLFQRGHAIECRIYAEDPDQGFLPSPGRVAALRVPGGPGIRDDTGVYAGYEVPIEYDPLLSKLVAHGATRTEALARMRRALAEYRVLGIATTLSFHERALKHPAFVAGDYDTTFAETLLSEPRHREEGDVAVAIAAAAIQDWSHRRRARGAPTGAGETSSWWRAGLAEAQGRRP